MSSLNRDHKFNSDMTHREIVLTAIAKEIESKFKRSKPRVSDYREYESRKNEIHEEIKNKKHCSELDWPDCEKVLLNNYKLPVGSSDFDALSSEDDHESQDYRTTYTKQPKQPKPMQNSKALALQR